MADDQGNSKVVNDPADVTVTNEQNESKLHAKAEARTEGAEHDSKTEGVTNAEQEAEANGNGEPVKKTDTQDDCETGHTDHSTSRYERGSGRSNGRKFAKLAHDEFKNMKETKDPREIREQVEFYFSDSNIVSDHHLFFEVEGPKNHPVPIKHIATFKRMQRFQPYSSIVAALRNSEVLDVVDDGKYSGAGNEAVKRKVPLKIRKFAIDEKDPPSLEVLYQRAFQDSLNRNETSVYVKGFAEHTGQLALEALFKPFGSLAVRKRRDDHGVFKGSVFVTFKSEALQQDFLAMEPKPTFKDKELMIMAKQEYSEIKCKEKGIIPHWQLSPEEQAKHAERDEERRRSKRGTPGGGRGGHGGSDQRKRGHRGDDRSDRKNGRRDDRHRGRSGRRGGKDRSRDQKDRHDRSHSSTDERDWNGRRDKFQSSKDFKGKRESHRNDHDSTSIERDAHGVPVVKDTRTEEDKAGFKKRKADQTDREDAAKKSKADETDRAEAHKNNISNILEDE